MEFDNLITSPFGLGEKLILELLKRGESVFTIFPTAKDVPMSFLGKKNIKYGFLKFEQDPLLEKSLPKRVKHVFHIFELYSGKFAKIFRANTLATLLLLDWAKSAGVEDFVYLSSGEVYGSGTDLDETSPCKPHGFYATAKYQAEMLLRFYERKFTIHTLRVFFTFGSEVKQGFVFGTAEAIRTGDPVESVYHRISPTFSDDIIAPLLELRGKKEGAVYNLCGSPTNIDAIIKGIGNATGKSTERTQIGKVELCGNSTRAKNILGYKESPLLEALSSSFADK
jgi:nucleoside-diphosphate-sugar epimerase